MSICNCNVCELGRTLRELTIKYEMSREDTWFLLNVIWDNLEDMQNKIDATYVQEVKQREI